MGVERLRSFTRAAALLVCVTCGQPRLEPARPALTPRDQVEADIAVINDYRLSDAVFRRYVAAAREIRRAQVGRIFSDTLFRRGRAGPTIADLAATLEQNPRNVEFYERHRTSLDSLTAELKNGPDDP